MHLKTETKVRLIKHVDFLQKELEDFAHFRFLAWKEYVDERNKRRNVERWVENIINSSIDIAKILLGAENLSIPDTYREAVLSLSLISIFEKDKMEKLSQWVRLRNVISHEYLDIKWDSIKKFVKEAEPEYITFLATVKKYLRDNQTSTEEESA